MKKNTNQAIGAASELKVCSYLLKMGYQVLRNVSPAGVDLVAIKAGKSYTIEVKTNQPSFTRSDFCIVANGPNGGISIYRGDVHPIWVDERSFGDPAEYDLLDDLLYTERVLAAQCQTYISGTSKPN